MKNLFLTTLLIFFCSTANAQIGAPVQIVNDPGSNAKILQAITWAKKQWDSAEKLRATIEKADDYVNKVNSYLQIYQTVQAYTNAINSIYNEGSKGLNELQDTNAFTPQEMNRISENYLAMFAKSELIIESAFLILEDDVFKMNDAERLTFLKEKEREINSIRSKVRRKTKAYKKLAAHKIYKNATVTPNN